MNAGTHYPYRGMPLTPAAIEDLLLGVFAGRIASRSALVDEVRRVHLARGGSDSQVNITSQIKKVLSSLKDKGMAASPSVGYWRIVGATPIAVEQEPVAAAPVNSILIEAETDEEAKPSSSEVIADKVIGTGSSAVYVYYLPAYRHRAEQNHEQVWPCKIGYSNGDPILRVLAQASTALPERPQIALVIRTSMPSVFESAIHNTLMLRGKKIDNSPGSEWYLTSPDEVESIASFILGAITQSDDDDTDVSTA